MSDERPDSGSNRSRGTGRRPFSRMEQGYTRNPKLMAVRPPARWAWAVSIDWSAEHNTDGCFFPDVVLGQAGVRASDTAALQAEGLWHSDGHDCPSCPQPGRGRYVVHDYLDHQTAADQRAAVSEKRRAAGRKGGRAKT